MLKKALFLDRDGIINIDHGYVSKIADFEFSDDGFVWKSSLPDDCPFEMSETFTGVYFTGRHSDYHAGDTFYPW